jgi:hypothetical protein
VFKLAPQTEVLYMVKDTFMKDYVEETEEALDYLDGSPDDSMLGGMMESLIETHNHQTMMAIELTKVVLSKNSEPNMSEDKVFDVFKKALQVITESSPLNSFVEKSN